MAIPSVSLVMSVFNGERFLREAVESILNQSFCDFEFIIIDDGSTDNSGSILASYQRSDPRIRTYHQENRGLIHSLNRGCALAQGKYIARMDADDIAVRDRLTWQFTFMEEHPEVAVLGGAFELIGQTGEVLRVVRHPLEPRELERAILESSAICHPSAFIRKTAFIAAGGYRNVLDAEDYDLWLRIAEHHPLANLPDILLKYRLHLGQVSVARCRSQALGTVAARTAASARRSGKPDPLDSVGEVTPALLARLGVSESTQHTTLARGYLSTIRNMCDAGEYTHALNTLEVLHSSELKHAEIWTIADLRLCAAEVYWHKNRFARSILTAAHAAITRPAILGRPVKQLVQRLTLLFRQLKWGGLIQSDTSI